MKSLKSIPLWIDQHPRPEDLPVSPLPEKVDVAVVGSGYTGLNAALSLTASGASVAVLEQETIAWGASSRTGGLLVPGLKAPVEQQAKKYGLETAKKMWGWALDSIDYIESLTKTEQIDCDFTRTGHASLAQKPSHYVRMKVHAEFLSAKLGYDKFSLVDPQDLGEEIGSSTFHGAMTDEISGSIHPAKFVMGLAKVAAGRGAFLVEKARVTKIKKNGFGFIISTSQGTVQANEVLLATGGYTTNLAPKIRMGIFPVGSYIIVTEPLSPELQAELSPRKRVFHNSKRLLNYFRLTPDGRMLLGGRANLSTGLDEIESASILREQMVRIFPQLANVPITHSWTGKLGISYDLMPHIGRIDGIHFAYGYSGHGLSIGSYLGYEVGKLMAGEISGSMYMDIKHPRYFFASLDKLYLPFVSTYFRLQDYFS